MLTSPNEIAPFQILRIVRSCAASGRNVHPTSPDVYGWNVTWGLAGAFAAALAYGVATVLQAVGARSAGRSSAPDARLALRLLRSAPYVIGLLLDGIGFALSLAALRSQPLFTVQAIVSSSLAVTAVLAVLALHARLAGLEWGALLLVTAGLVLLGLSANDQRPAHVNFSGRFVLLLVVIASATVVALLVSTRDARSDGGQGGRNDAWALGLLAGLMYGAGGIGARILAKPRSVHGLLLDPALWAMAIAGILGLLLYAMALQRGSVTVATAATVVAETLVPAAIGITLLGDRPAHGRTPLAAAGFAITVTGSLLLARYGAAPAVE
jgi:drug/metabolite transporter (DMT)-like permease